MSRELSADEFDEFYKEVHGNPPFKWQSELAKKVLRDGWPEYLDMPTASGKTSVMDIAVFHLAMQAGERIRSAPVRIAFVVDRRLVVDGAFEHATELAKKLSTAKEKVTGIVAERLKSMTDGEPLKVARLRGAVPQENDWARTPSQPLIIVSTIDQAGSRLLFRGYGVSDFMKPIHAGLLGSDVLYILDEAHTSTSFMDTLKQIGKIRAEWKEDLPFKYVFMSATLNRKGKDVFPKSKKSMMDGPLEKRMDAHKYAHLVEVKKDNELKDALVKCALNLNRPSSDGHKNPKTIGVVVNRVNLARSVFKELRGKLQDAPEISVHLLTGRSRPLERDMIIGAEIDKIKPRKREPGYGKNPEQGGVSFFVATQSIEVGVDIDLDALVTQVAPIDSLRQRFGRLDRIGEKGTTHGIVVASKESVGKSYKDPIYGDRLRAVWEYLNGLKQGVKDCKQCSDIAADLKRLKVAPSGNIVDFGVNHFPEDGWEEMTAKEPRRITLMPAYVRLWSQTSPRPDPDPEPSIFLHGPDSSSADVHIVWRADITKEMLDDREGRRWQTRLEACRPSQLEAVAVPVWTARRWMSDAKPADVLGDIEGLDRKEDEAGDKGLKAVRWRGSRSQDTKIVEAAEIAPGDTLVVPSETGGCDTYGWDESSDNVVVDIGMEAGIVNRRSLEIRLGKEYLMHAYRYHMGQDGPAAADQDSGIAQAVKRVGEMAAEYAEERDAAVVLDRLRTVDGLPTRWKNALDALCGDRSAKSACKKVSKTVEENGNLTKITSLSVALDPPQAIRVLKALSPDGAKLPTAESEDVGLEASTDDSNENDSGGGQQKLLHHSKGVERFAKEFASRIGLDDGRTSVLALAGLLHDAGKAERRVQAMLRRLDPDDVDVDNADMLAKSKASTKSYQEYKTHLDRAHLPEGYRHECWSVRLASSHRHVKSSGQKDLIMYLIGVHHGRGRPMFAAVKDPHKDGMVEWSVDGEDMSASVEHGLERLDSGWIDMCDKLYHEYGPWCLAHMESIVRLADHRQSAKENRHG